MPLTSGAFGTKGVTFALCGLAAVGLAVGIAGCEGTAAVPSDSVAIVAGAPIKKALYEHWLVIDARQEEPDAQPVVPDPPTYGRCMAALAGQLKAAGKPTASTATLRNQCEERYATAKREAIALLIGSQWLLDEARTLRLTYTPAAVRNQLNTYIQAYPSHAAFAKFVHRTQMTMADLLYFARNLLLQRTVPAALGDDPVITSAQVTAFYAHNRTRLGHPAERQLRLLITKSRAAGVQARQAIETGMPWAAAVKKYSFTSFSQATAGMPAGPLSRQPAYERAIVSAPLRDVEGPVISPYGYLLFMVTSVVRPFQPTLDQARVEIVDALRAQRQAALSSRRTIQYQRKYRLETKCAPGFVLAGYCGNAA